MPEYRRQNQECQKTEDRAAEHRKRQSSLLLETQNKNEQISQNPNPMTQEELLKELEELAARSNIGIRYEKGDFEGGFCVLKADRLIMINKKLPTPKRAAVLAQGLAEVGIDEIYLKPVVREFIEDELAKAAKE